MSKWQKLLERIRCNPKTVRFDEVKKIWKAWAIKERNQGVKPVIGHFARTAVCRSQSLSETHT